MKNRNLLLGDSRFSTEFRKREIFLDSIKITEEKIKEKK